MSTPLGATLNLGFQVVAFLLILIGLRFAIKTHKAYKEGKDDGQKFEKTHKNLMTTAVLVSGLGVVIWMVPSLILGWYYDFSAGGLDYGSGGYRTYFYVFNSSAFLEHWYLIAIMAVLGTVVAVLGVYLVLRMRWAGFPQRLAVQNFRRLMIITWSLWTVNVLVGVLVFLFFAFNGAGG